MTDIDQILNRIRVELARHGRKSKVSRETGIHVVTLTRIGKPDWNPSADTIRTLEAAIGKLFPADEPTHPHQPE